MNIDFFRLHWLCPACTKLIGRFCLTVLLTSRLAKVGKEECFLIITGSDCPQWPIKNVIYISFRSYARHFQFKSNEKSLLLVRHFVASDLTFWPDIFLEVQRFPWLCHSLRRVSVPWAPQFADVVQPGKHLRQMVPFTHPGIACPQISTELQSERAWVPRSRDMHGALRNALTSWPELDFSLASAIYQDVCV